MNTSRLIFIAFVLFLPGFVLAENLNDRLIEATRKEDLALVKSLLDQGADVNAKARYNATPLAIACDKGNLDLVKLLLERGADVNAEDTFYHSTPLSWAAESGNVEIAKLLIQKGAKADDALTFMVYSAKEDMVRMLLENAKFSPEKMTEALEAAISQDQKGIAKILQDAGAVRKKASFTLPPDTLKMYTGKFKNNEGNEVALAPEENSLKGTVSGQEFVLVPKDDKTFEMAGSAGYKFVFEVADGKANRLDVTRPDGSTSIYNRVDESTAAAEETKSVPTVNPTALKETRKVSKPLNWPSFRGIEATGVADGQYPPVQWDVEKGSNVAWKTAIPGLANSSPIVWGDRIFLTTAITSDPESKLRHGLYGDVEPSADLSKHTWRIYGIDKKSGKILWDKVAFEGSPNVKRHPKSTQSNSTPVTDGKHVVALFGYGGLQCYDFNGNLLWKNDLGILDSGWFYDPDYQWGHGSSPVLYEDLVIVQADLQKNSYIAAFSIKDGKQVWKTLRDEIPSWGSPTVVKTKNGSQIVTNGTNYVRGYDAKSGKEIWKLKNNSEITVPTPFVAHDLIFVTSGYPPTKPIYAIRPYATGDISLKEGTESNEFIAWSKSQGGPYMPTPIVYGDYLYTCANNGVVTCYNAKTGERIYQKRLGGQGSGFAFTASPIAADGKLYFTSEDGEIYVVKAGPEYEVLSVNKMNEVAMATPAISDGMIVIRTLEHVYGIQAK
jgi:outer membrane protein assembly factor BamB